MGWSSRMLEAQVVGIDIGQTGTRAAVVAEGEVRSFHFGHRASPLGDDTVSGLRAVAEGLAAAATRPTSVAVSLSGFDGGRDYAELARMLSSTLGSPAVYVASDAAAALAGSLGSTAGVCTAWGTGVVTLAADGAGGWWQVDGRGFLLGDNGGGSWVGHRGMLAGLDHLEGRGGSALLADAIAIASGGPVRLHEEIYGSPTPAALFAAFAPHVLDAADAGDGEARRIVADAAAEVAATTIAAAGNVEGISPVALTGGMARAGSRQLLELLRLLEEDPSVGDVEVYADAPLDGALRIAGGEFAPALLPSLIHSWEED
jgi:N-acetylglucosamine kinase-like BadF-type ATPase